ncbi:hypothetical protein QVD17_37425 [Tagetes erecta]|uniref:Protein kinase domain-containing protein n=1 Tax=Tagetes erecta TaxID=13708 RepID=A0AAD8NK07_TARER|nr:hypothetical protein QVD17_37425 [Tagetes erecta]
MEEFWKGIDTPAKHPSERGLKMLPRHTLQDPTVYEDQHHDIKQYLKAADQGTSSNSLKVADFGLSKFQPMKQQVDTIRTKTIAGTEVYMDPEYWNKMKYKRESDIYSFGVVLFEVLSGRLAYDPFFLEENRMGLAPIAKRHVTKRTLNQLIDPKLIEDAQNYIFTLNREISQDHFDAFSEIACQCLADAQDDRPKMKVIIKELQNALNLQVSQLQWEHAKNLEHSKAVDEDEDEDEDEGRSSNTLKTEWKKKVSDIYSKHIVGTMLYVDPEYLTTGKYNRGSDIYSFGVVLFEVLSGRVANDSIYTDENEMGLAPIARRRFKNRTLKELIDPEMIKEDSRIFILNKAPNQNSFEAFSKIAYRCLAETQAKRPTMEVVISELQNALKLQEDTVVLLKFLLQDIELATKNFAETYCIGLDTNGTMYKAELHQFVDNSMLGADVDEPSKKRNITVAIKRITSRKGRQGKQGFLEEFEMRAYKHPNIVSLLGFCEEGDEMILVYEHVSGRSLDEYLKSVEKVDAFTWTHRLLMCLEIARGLDHLHTKMAKGSTIHTDIRSANIMLEKDGKAKIGYFVITNLHPTNDEGMEMKVYEDPEFETTGKMKKECAIYSFGVVLFEIFCGRVAYDSVYTKENEKGLAPIARQCCDDGTIERLMDLRLKKETGHADISTSIKRPDQDSLEAFFKIAYACLGEAVKRPTMEMVIKELERALNFHDPKP